MALQMLYQADLGGAALPQIFAAFEVGEYVDAGAPKKGKRGAVAGRQALVEVAFEYARTLVEGTLARLGEIDELIRSQTENWRLERMPAVDRNILRLAVFEMLSEPDVPKLVVIDEAVELAKKFGSDQTSRFVNGLLDGLLKSQVFPGRMT
jgi:N utilization substance protein B